MRTLQEYNDDYKKRREELLFERERSLLPETQPYAEYMKQIHDVEILINPINEKIKNHLFNIKKQEYAKSDLEITKELANHTKWDMEEVDNRSKVLAAYALDIWKKLE